MKQLCMWLSLLCAAYVIGESPADSYKQEYNDAYYDEDSYKTDSNDDYKTNSQQKTGKFTYLLIVHNKSNLCLIQFKLSALTDIN